MSDADEEGRLYRMITNDDHSMTGKWDAPLGSITASCHHLRKAKEPKKYKDLAAEETDTFLIFEKLGKN